MTLKAWFSCIVIVGNRKQVQAHREQINCKCWLKVLSLLAWTCLRLPIFTTITTVWEPGLRSVEHVFYGEMSIDVLFWPSIPSLRVYSFGIENIFFWACLRKMADFEGFKTFCLKSWKVSQTSQRFQILWINCRWAYCSSNIKLQKCHRHQFSANENSLHF